MSVIFGNSGSVPGCFAKQKNSGGVKGAVFTLVGGGSQCIVTRFSFSQSDDFAPVKCLGDKAYINLFGKSAVSEMDVTLTLFLIKGRSHTGVLSSVKDKFKGKRMSNGKSTCKLTVGSKTLVTGYASGLTLEADSSQLGIASATCHVVSLEDR